MFRPLRTSARLALMTLGLAAAQATADVTPHGPVLRVTPSTAASYVARGTLPLPQGWTWEPHCPFGLRRDGQVHPAQWWPVAYHPDGTVSVVELAATVPGEESLPSNPDPIAFEVVVSDDPFYIQAPKVDDDLVDLLTTPGALRLRVTDSLGNQYVGLLSQGIVSPATDIEVIGRAKSVYTSTDLLYRTVEGSAGLPYLGGFKAWFTIHDEGRTVELDLRWHNSVVNPGGPMLPNVVFEEVELILPTTWKATSRWPLPTAGSMAVKDVDGAPARVLPLVEDGPTPHLLRQRGHLTWRLVLHRPGDLPELSDRLDRRGWGAVRGAQGGWEDPNAAAWLATQTIAPDLTVWETYLAQELRDDREAIESALASGTPYYYVQGMPALGPFHALGVSYGGMTSGSEVYQTPGTELIWTAENDGLAAAEMKHRMVLDRQYGWFFRPDGKLIDAFDLLESDGSLSINVFNNEFVDVFNNGALGFESTADIYANVQPRPEYETDLLGTTPYDGLEQHDAQHGIRAMYTLKTLIWAANDRMARHDLTGQAALWHMELHDGPGGRLDSIAKWAAEHPHVGGEFGRGEAWVMDAVATWYALADSDKRAQLNGWMTKAVTAIWTLSTPLDVFYGNRQGKITEYYEFDNQYAIIQWYEHAIAINALAAVRESWASTPVAIDLMEDLIVDGALAIWRTGWKPGTNGPFDQQAVAWMDPDLPAFPTPAAIPTDGTGGGPDQDQVGGPLGVAGRYADAAQAVEILEAASSLVGSPDPLTAFEQMYTFPLNLNNRAPLIAWLQQLDG